MAATVKPRTLRNYQRQAVKAWHRDVGNGKTRSAVVLPTGTGKTDVGAGVIVPWAQERGAGSVLVMAHRDELLNQVTERIAQHDPMLPVGRWQASRRDVGRHITVASIQTLWQSGGWEKFEKLNGRPAMGLVDECFPAGTLVGDVPIESIRTGDYVDSWDEVTAQPVRRRVTATMRSRPSSLVKVRTDRGDVICTPGHPFLTTGGWVPAIALQRDVQVLSFTHDAIARDALHGVRRAGDVDRSEQDRRMASVGSGVLLGRAPGRVGATGQLAADGAHEPRARVGADEGVQPDAQPGNAGEDGGHTARGRAQAARARRERQAATGRTAGARRSARVADGGHLSHANRRAAVSLQAGHRAPGNESLRRGGRRLALESSQGGRPARRAVALTRVAGVQVLEPGRDGTYGGLCPRGVVYNLEVDGTHAYRVGDAGLVVHNCHHAVSPSYLSVLNAMGAMHGHSPTPLLGLTATMVRGDRIGLGDAWQSVAFQRDIGWAIREGFLVVPRGKVIVVKSLHLDDAKVSGGDYQEGELGSMIEQGADEIVDAWVKHAEGRITASFAPTVEAARAIADEFNDRGIAAGVVTGETPKDERARLYAALAAGDLKVLSGVMVTTEGWDCLSDDTEILTADGWRGMGEVAVGDMVHALNRETGLLESAPVTRYVERPMNPSERMFTARSQHVDIRTSEGHEFHVGTRHSRELKTVTGAELAARRGTYRLPLAADSAKPFPGVPLTDDELRFVAWFMTDGGFVRSTTVEINQSKHHKDEIRALLTRLGFDFVERVRPPSKSGYPTVKSSHEFRIPKGTHSGSLRRNGWAHLAEYLDKDVAPALHDMTREQFLAFWREALKGDGDRNWLTVDRRSQVDAYTMMASLRGLSSSYKTRTAPSGKDWHRVAVRDRQWLTSEPADPRSARLALEAPREDERVWCVTNEHSTLITRRNGKIAIIGNCPAVSCILQCRPTRLPGLYQQIVGRGLRLDPERPEKEDCLVLDCVGASRYQKLTTLVDLYESAEVDSSELDDVLPEELDDVEEEGEGAFELPKAKLIGPKEYEDVNLFADSGYVWLFTYGGVRFLPAGDRIAVMWQHPKTGKLRVGHCLSKPRYDRSTRTYDRDGVWLRDGWGSLDGWDLDTGRLALEAWVDNYAGTLARKGASWRKGKSTPPTDAQIIMATRLGIEDPQLYSKAALSDEISIAFASQMLD